MVQKSVSKTSALPAMWKVGYTLSPFWIWSFAMRSRQGATDLGDPERAISQRCLNVTMRPVFHIRNRIKKPWPEARAGSSQTGCAPATDELEENNLVPTILSGLASSHPASPSRFWKDCAPFLNRQSTSVCKQCFVPCFSSWYGMTALQTALEGSFSQGKRDVYLTG